VRKIFTLIILCILSVPAYALSCGGLSLDSWAIESGQMGFSQPSSEDAGSAVTMTYDGGKEAVCFFGSRKPLPDKEKNQKLIEKNHARAKAFYDELVEKLEQGR